MATKEISNQQGFIILTVAFTGFLYGFLLQSFAPILPYLAAFFTLDNRSLGAIIGVFTLSAVFVCIPAGVLGDKIRVKPLLVMSAVLTLFGCLLSLLFDNYFLLLVSRFITGLGCAILMTLGPKLLIQTIHQQRLDYAIAVYSQAITVGFVVGIVIGQWSFSWWGFIGFQWTLAFAAFVMLILLLPIISPPADKEEHRVLRPNLAAILLACVFFFHGAGMTQMITFTPIDLSRLGRSESSIAWITAGFFIPSTLFTIWFCNYCKTVATQRLAMIICQSLLFLTTLILLFSPNFILVSILQGVLFIGILPIAYLLTNSLVPLSQFGFIYGLYTTCYTAGVFIGGQAIGLLRDQFSSEIGYLGIAGFALCGVIAMLILPCKAINSGYG